MAATAAALPSRQNTVKSTLSDDAVPDSDPSNTAGLLGQRLQAWKHAVMYIEDYVEATEKIHKAHAKEYEKALKTVSKPLKEGEHFDPSLGGIAGLFENMRQNTQDLINSNLETEKNLKGSVLPIVERLRKEIKHKTKEIAHGAEKSAKDVEKARNITQKHIELLGHNTAAFESTGGKLMAKDDPYVVHRGVLHRLHTQVLEENNHRNDLIALQSNFEQFETHVVEVLQQVMEVFTQLTAGQAEKNHALYSDMLGAAQRIPPDFEWRQFVQRSGQSLVNPYENQRIVEAITFSNMDHSATKPLIEGSLERKSRNKLDWRYTSNYYVVTPSKFLHEFKDSDNVRHDPQPEMSIYLPDAIIGATNGDKFHIRGKDRSKSLSSKLTGTSEFAFKAHSAAEAQKWFEIIRNVSGADGPAPTLNASPEGSVDGGTKSGGLVAEGGQQDAGVEAISNEMMHASTTMASEKAAAAA